ncbi:Lrp/AsnC family transcriptional regulator [Nocardia seriolae]|uniref:AsnC family transcriptional regulator n=1 Tax=Nocardia seriolae TaxID=37332 RepID=A0A0B8NB84_9NOCA|nr:AsnC family transcriptional regulator [Nocardia seriolae]MTJ61380.1 AsnC family transcriptional regulator [Nocardia seriolae]MTJ74243.1 AsnC family transcriptional regulator [Nocardia seriolae]MTJ91197.1 AsnC family transcriptional regulator [Nocardia seriolae]MTK35162.1 AsnC family transcriptional regulator [Nocardia seriolae]MTK39355.1 AsnC family transcriptional regulator [Nocardia seriolae]
MPEDTAKSPDTAIPESQLPESAVLAAFDERDLDLVNALQINPRASWTRIGESLGMDATTAARRWGQLTGSGLAWITAYAPEFATIAYLRLRCRAERLAEISERVTAMPWVFSVERVTGGFPLQLSVAVENLAALDDFTAGELAALPGVEEIRTAVNQHVYVEGSHWRPQALDPGQRTLLTEPRGPARPHRRAPAHSRPRPGDAALVLALSADGRRTIADLARDTGLTETTVRRRISDMTSSGRLVFRCDFAEQAAGWNVTANYWADLPASAIDTVGAALASWPEIRLCAATADDSNVMLIGWLRGPREGVLLETRLQREFPQLRIIERQLTLRTLKRMGRILSPRGRAVGYVPFDVWGRDPDRPLRQGRSR